MRSIKSILVATLMLQSSLSLAATGFRTSIVDYVEMESSTSPGIEDLMYVQQSIAWGGSLSCSTSFAYFNAKENPHFVATVLAARVSERPLRVFVDDSLPKINGFCRITNLQL